MVMEMKKCFALGITLAAASASFAQENVSIKFLNTGAGRNVKMSVNSGSDFKGAFGGQLNLQVNTSSTSKIIAGLCADPSVNMASGTTQATATTSNALGDRGARAAHLINTYFNSILAESNAAIKNDKMMALQVAVWEVLVEDLPTFSVATGAFRAKAFDGGNFSSAQQGYINTYLANNGTSVADYYQAASVNNCPVSQSVMAPVPEPATIGALSVGALALLRRRRSKR